jgi:excisionase family DNA binding protein
MLALISHAVCTMLKSSHTYYQLWDKSMPEWPSYTIKEASEKTGYNEEHLRRLIRQGRIEATKVGPTYLIPAQSLEKYMAEIKDTDDARIGPRKKRK